MRQRLLVHCLAFASTTVFLAFGVTTVRCDEQTETGRNQEDRRVAVLIHGWMGNPSNDCPEEPQSFAIAPEAQWTAVARLLTAGGYDVYTARYPSSLLHTSSLADSAACLGRQLAALNLSSTDEVALIGHSMGGVVARAYVESSDEDCGVDSIITLGSPHTGVAEVVRLMKIALPDLAVVAFCSAHAGLCDLLPDRMGAFNDQTPGAGSRHVKQTYIASTGPSLMRGTRVPPPLILWSLLVGRANLLDDDGLVEFDSAAGSTLDRGQAHREVYVGHSAGLLTLVDAPYETYFDGQESLACIAEALAIQTPLEGAEGQLTERRTSPPRLVRGPENAQHSSSGSHVVPTGSGSETSYSPLVTGVLTEREEWEQELVLDGDSVVVALGWTGSGPHSFRLVSPMDVVITPDNVEDELCGSNYVTAQRPDGSGGAAIYYLTGSITGTWSALITASEEPSTAFAMYAALDSPLILAADRIEPVLPLEPVMLHARIGETSATVDGAQVTAIVQTTSVASVREPMPPQGQGEYGGWLRAPAIPGLYEVLIRARGTTPSGVTYEREVTRALEVTRPPLCLPVAWNLD